MAKTAWLATMWAAFGIAVVASAMHMWPLAVTGWVLGTVSAMRS